MKPLVLFILVAAAVGGYLVYTNKIDPKQAQEVLETVDDYAEAVVTSVDDAKKTVETINERNRETEKRIEESIKE